jgi:hypothetical protein
MGRPSWCLKWWVPVSSLYVGSCRPGCMRPYASTPQSLLWKTPGGAECHASNRRAKAQYRVLLEYVGDVRCWLLSRMEQPR